MKNTIRTIVTLLASFITVLPQTVAAMDTIGCSSNKYGVMVHVNSENAVADVFLNDGKTIVFEQTELEEIKLKWVASTPPFDKNRLMLRRKENPKDSFKFKIEIKGSTGVLKTSNGVFQLDCDWSR
ncbi:MAG: hypothetical protein PHN75_13155 [Syntrophales bacterium]|nr:hypothetical protein [Syntrophales bacterium]